MVASLLQLPWVVQETIFKHYVLEPGGYYYNGESGKFRAADNKKIDLALIYTCKKLAAHIGMLALKTNVLNFSVVYSEKLWSKVGRLDDVLRRYDYARSQIFSLTRRISTDPLVLSLSREIKLQASQDWPQFKPMLDRWRNWHDLGHFFYTAALHPTPRDHWYQAGSTFRDFVSYMLRLMATKTNLLQLIIDSEHAEASEAFPAGMVPRPTLHSEGRRRLRIIQKNLARFCRSPLVYSAPKHWLMPTDETLRALEECIPTWTQLHPPIVGIHEPPSDWRVVKWRLSATAAAIHFLSTFPEEKRSALRRLALHEDQMSATQAECHALGLIPFCRENQSLRVERRVNLWRVVLKGDMKDHLDSLVLRPDRLGVGVRRVGTEDGSPEALKTVSGVPWATQLTRVALHKSILFAHISNWIEEANALSDAGMPSNSFTLIFDGEPAIGQAIEWFESLTRLVIWEEASYLWRTSRARPGVSGHEEVERGLVTKHEVHANFVKNFGEILQGTSIVSCNFPIFSWDQDAISTIFAHHSHLDSQIEWDSAQSSFMDGIYDIVELRPPLPNWLQLQLEDGTEEYLERFRERHGDLSGQS